MMIELLLYLVKDGSKNDINNDSNHRKSNTEMFLKWARKVMIN